MGRGYNSLYTESNALEMWSELEQHQKIKVFITNLLMYLSHFLSIIKIPKLLTAPMLSEEQIIFIAKISTEI